MKTETVCKLNHEELLLNDKILRSNKDALSISDWLMDIYKHFGMDYAKFFKMDTMSKAALLASEMLLKHESWGKDKHADCSIVLANGSSSLNTDVNFENTIAQTENYFPSPSVFVYTLPNIALGEIAIRHKITGNTAFFVAEMFTPELLQELIRYAFWQTNTKKAICGWVDAYLHQLDVRLFYVKYSDEIMVKQQNGETVE